MSVSASNGWVNHPSREQGTLCVGFMALRHNGHSRSQPIPDFQMIHTRNSTQYSNRTRQCQLESSSSVGASLIAALPHVVGYGDVQEPSRAHSSPFHPLHSPRTHLCPSSTRTSKFALGNFDRQGARTSTNSAVPVDNNSCLRSLCWVNLWNIVVSIYTNTRVRATTR